MALTLKSILRSVGLAKPTRKPRKGKKSKANKAKKGTRKQKNKRSRKQRGGSNDKVVGG